MEVTISKKRLSNTLQLVSRKNYLKYVYGKNVH